MYVYKEANTSNASSKISLFGKKSEVLRGSEQTQVPAEKKKEANVIPAKPMEAWEQIDAKLGAKGIRAKLLGGLGVKKLSKSARQGELWRPDKDIDMIVKKEDAPKLKETMLDLGYRYDQDTFMRSFGEKMLFYDDQNKRRVDVLIGKFQMCFTFSFDLDRSGPLTVTDLFLSKIQNYDQISTNDFKDLIAMLFDFQLTDDESGIKRSTILGKAAENWGLCKTITTNLNRIKGESKAVNPEIADVVNKKAQDLLDLIKLQPKSARWKWRALVARMVGDKYRFYVKVDTDLNNRQLEFRTRKELDGE